jgi:hypothetical protein
MIVWDFMSQALPNPEFSSVVENEKLNITLPRSLWFDGLLLLVTVGLYAPFLWVGMVRDLRKLTNETLTPWLWFFVPLFGLPQLWALPAMNRMLGRYESQMGVKSWQQTFISWVVLTIIVTFGYAFIGRLEDDSWWLLAGMSAYILCILGWIHRVKRVKTADARIVKARDLKQSHWWEWVLVIVLTPAWSILLLLMAYDYVNTEVLEVYEPGAVFVDAEYGLEFPMNSVTWSVISYDENTEALHSFQIGQNELTAYIYHYEDRELNDLSKNRYFEIMDWDDSSRCSEHQTFLPGTLIAKTVLTCESAGLWGTNADFVSILDTGDDVFELYITVNQSEDSRVIESALEAAEGFTLR